MLSSIIIGTSEQDLYMNLWWFLVYSIMGWAVESVYISICNKKLTNRGFIHGPICPIYGVGAMTVHTVLRPFQNSLLILYFMGMALATLIEYTTARITMRVFGCVWWDYTNKPFNYKGILCLESCIVWGAYSVFEFVFLHDFVFKVIDTIPRDIGMFLLVTLLIYFFADFAYCLFQRVHGNNSIEGEANNILKRDV